MYCQAEENRLFVALVLGGGSGAPSVPCGTFTLQFPVRNWSSLWGVGRHSCICWAWAGSLPCSRGVSANSGWSRAGLSCPRLRRKWGSGLKCPGRGGCFCSNGSKFPTSLGGDFNRQQRESLLIPKTRFFFSPFLGQFGGTGFCCARHRWANLWQTLAVQAQVFLATIQP